ncbi:MAG: HlyC/CorC family transporter, partial [Bdellovibrionales bacterium]|nr:HlyC/CorC family transporter [Bdellovibrionales bacterium]
CTLFEGMLYYNVLRPIYVSFQAEELWNATSIASGIALVVLGLGLPLLALVSTQLARSLALTYPEKVLCSISGPLLFGGKIFGPLIKLLRAFTQRLYETFSLRAPFRREEAASPEELSEMVELSSEAGQIEESERKMIQRVIEFSDTLVREVMTPRTDVVSVQIDASLDDVLEVFDQERLTRLIVIGDGLDDVRGIVHVKDLIHYITNRSEEFKLTKILRPPIMVYGSRPIDQLLPELRKKGNHMAIVLDEHGGVDGLVTIEDLVEEIVGEILDEYDSPADEIDAQRTKSGDLLVDGSMLIDDLNTIYKTEIPIGEYDTLAGFVIHNLGRIPALGEIFEFNGFRIKIEETTQNRITLLRLTSVKKRPLNSSGELMPRDSKASVG